MTTLRVDWGQRCAHSLALAIFLSGVVASPASAQSTQLGLFLNEFETFSTGIVPAAIEDYADAQSSAGCDRSGPWRGGFCPEDSALVPLSRNVYAWTSDVDEDTIHVHAVCALYTSVDLTDQYGHLFGVSGSHTSVPADAFSVATNIDETVEVSINLDDFHYEGDIDVYARVYCVVNPEIDTNDDGEISADPNDWTFGPKLLSIQYDRSIDATATLEVDGLHIAADGHLAVDSDSQLVIDSLENLDVTLDNVEISDFDVNEVEGLLFEAIGEGIDALVDAADGISAHDVQDVLDGIQDAMDDTLDTIDDDLDVEDWVEIGEAPTINRFDDPSTDSEALTLTLPELINVNVAMYVNDDGATEEGLLEGLNSALNGVFEFETSTAVSSTYSIDLSTSLASVSTAHTASHPDPELEVAFDVEMAGDGTVSSCGAELLLPSGDSSLVDFTSTDADLDLVVPYDAIELAVYHGLRSGAFLECEPFEYEDTTYTGATLSMNIIPVGAPTAARGTYPRSFGIGTSDGVLVSIPVRANATGEYVKSGLTFDVAVEATASLNLVVTLDDDCAGNLSLTLRDIYLSDYDGVITVSGFGADFDIPAPDPTDDVNEELRAMVQPTYRLVATTYWEWEGCIYTQKTRYSFEIEYCEHCVVDLGVRVGNVEFAGYHLELEETEYDDATFSAGFSFETESSCAEEETSSRPDWCSPTWTDWEWHNEPQLAFDFVRYANYEMAALIDMLEARYGIDAMQDFIREMFEMAKVGPFLPRDFTTRYAEQLFAYLDAGRTFFQSYAELTRLDRTLPRVNFVNGQYQLVTQPGTQIQRATQLQQPVAQTMTPVQDTQPFAYNKGI